MAVWLRIGASLCSLHLCCHCGAQVDHFATHGLSCRWSEGRHSRHAGVNNIIHRALTSAKIPSRLAMGLIIQDALNKQEIIKWVWLTLREDGASCQLRYSITEDSNTHDRFAVALSAPGVGVIGHVPREFSRVVRHFLLHGGTLTCKVSGRRQRGKGLEVPCLYTCMSALCRCRSIPISRHFLRSEAHALLKTGRRGALVIQVCLWSRVRFKTRLYGHLWILTVYNTTMRSASTMESKQPVTCIACTPPPDFRQHIYECQYRNHLRNYYTLCTGSKLEWYNPQIKYGKLPEIELLLHGECVKVKSLVASKTHYI